MLQASSEPLSRSELYSTAGSAPLRTDGQPHEDRRPVRQSTGGPASDRGGAATLGEVAAQVEYAPPREPTEATLQAGALRANRSVLKRLMDIAGAMIGMIVLLPFLCIVALVIRLESPGPALFRQRRAGRGGVVFQIYKFRSMNVLEDGDNIAQAAQSDGRVTRVGAFLRRSCIDELPQLINVIKGDMSLVGPRPHALAHDAYYSELLPDYNSRLLVRPGIAGLAQVSGYRGATPTIESMAGRVALDREYIDTWSFAQDVRILLRAVTDGPFHPAAF
jgi:putative colanic acid biosysnthesis UDP-glucose lipid carrier transferase